MAKEKALSWNEDQLKVRALLEQGKTPKQCREAGFDKSLVSRVDRAVKAEKKAQGEKKDEKVEKGSLGGGGGGGDGNPLSPAAGHTRVSTLSTDPVIVGRFIIEPSDWYVNQYGGFLILNTYEHARKRFGYNGTVGDFVCDACQVMRKVMGLDLVSCEYLVKEGDNGESRGGESTGRHVLSTAGHERAGSGAGSEAKVAS